MNDFTTRFGELFNSLTTGEQVSIYNEYAEANCYELVYWMDDFNELMRGDDPIDLALRVHHGNFNPYHGLFTFDGYANLESFDCLSAHIDLDSLADWYAGQERTLADIIGVDAYDIYEDDDEDEDDED